MKTKFEATNPTSIGTINLVPTSVKPLIVIPQEKFLSKLRINPWIKWLILGEILGGSAYLAVLLSNGTMVWIGQLAFMYALAFMIEGAGPIWIKQQLEFIFPIFSSFINLSEEQIEKWYMGELRRIFNPFGMAITGIVISVLGMVSFIVQTQWYQFPKVWWGTYAGNLVVTIVVSILAFLAGALVFVVIQLALTINRLPRLPLKMTIYQHPMTGISMVGTILQKVTLLGLVYFGLVAVTAFFLSPFSNNMGWVLPVWFGVGGTILFLFFIIPQYSIHVAMANAKALRIRAFTDHLSKSLEQCIQSPTSETMENVKELFEIYNHLLQMPKWPFNTRNLISLITAIILPILLSIVQKIVAP